MKKKKTKTNKRQCPLNIPNIINRKNLDNTFSRFDTTQRVTVGRTDGRAIFRQYMHASRGKNVHVTRKPH